MSSPFDVELPPFKVVIIGDAGVGKSSLLERLVHARFNNQEPVTTIAVDFLEHRVRLDDGAEVRLHLWDTAGQERFNALSSAYTRGAAAIIYAYDADQMRTITSAERWARQCEERSGRAPVRLLVGLKCDLVSSDRSHEEAMAAAERLGVDRHCRCSARTGADVNDVFRMLAQRLRLVAVDQALRDEERRLASNELFSDLRIQAMMARNACQC